MENYIFNNLSPDKIKDMFVYGLGTHIVYKYRSFDDYNLDALTNNYLWFDNPMNFNDIYEGYVKHKNYTADEVLPYFSRLLPNLSKVKLKDMVNDMVNNNKLRSILEEADKKLLKSRKICCFSTEENNKLMWAHYSKSNSGYVLEFDMSLSGHFFAVPCKIEYIKELKEGDFINNQEEFVDLLLRTKSAEWEYEKEIRVVKSNVENKNYYNPASLRSVIFGTNTTKENIEKVKELLSQYTHIVYKQCYLDPDKYGLSIINLE